MPPGTEAVLRVLGGTDAPMGIRQVARVAGVSANRASQVLSELADHGLVVVEQHGSGRLCRLNRAHLAADALLALVDLRGRLIECILVGITQALLMGIVSIFVPQRQILLIATVCGITNMIPYLGPIMGTIFGALLYLGSDLPITSVYGLVAAAAGAHVIDNIFIAPAVLSHNVDLHPLTVALVLVIGGELLGTLGLLIAIPVASTIKVIAQEFYANYRLRVQT